MEYIYAFLEVIMNWCYGICHNYGLAIVLFTFISKIILLPVSLWTYFNSITMIKIQPDINYIKVKYYGQSEIIAEEEAKLQKEKGYSPLLSMVPTIIQLILLMGVVGVIKRGMNNPNIDMNIASINLGLVPSQVGLSLIWSPILAGLSSYILCVAQNASNVLQSEQSKYNKYGTMIFSVALSLYLGWFVAVGTAFYWVCSNLFAVLQLYITNAIVRPRKYVDYERLEDSRKKLNDLQDVGKKKREGYFSENRRRERADYKRFFSVVNKHLVFYSEGSGFYKYFKGFIEYILNNTNITIHYITSDPNDQIFELEKTNSKIRGYYIGENKLITLMMKMDADVVVMTMPDLENFHIKRSYVRDDVEYIYVEHGLDSANLTRRKGSVDHYDTIFSSAPHRKAEILATEKVYGLKPKKLLEVGYVTLDDMLSEYNKAEQVKNKKPQILIAPSWQPDNIVDSCIEEILDELKKTDYAITVRPHPQHVKHKPEYFEALKAKYAAEGIEIQTDFSKNSTVMESDLLITDWSAISLEFAFTTLRPVLFINTPMKVMNPDYKDIDIVPVNIEMRDSIGKNLELDQLDQVGSVAGYLIDHSEEYRDIIYKWRSEHTYNLGHAAEIGGQYIVKTIVDKIEKRKVEK